MSRPTGQLGRALASLTIGVELASRRRGKALDDVRTTMYVQPLRIPISGLADNTWLTEQKEIVWELPYLHAPAQSRFPWGTPHFSGGVELVSRDDLVIFHTQVVNWLTSEEGWTYGANVEFAAMAPNYMDTLIAWSAVAHLSFHGYATYSEDGPSAPEEASVGAPARRLSNTQMRRTLVGSGG